MRCRFDPPVIQCTGADGPNCLTSAQVDAAKKIYAGINDPKPADDLVCKADPLAYPVKDGIPVMLEEEARKLRPEEEVV